MFNRSPLDTSNSLHKNLISDFNSNKSSCKTLRFCEKQGYFLPFHSVKSVPILVCVFLHLDLIRRRKHTQTIFTQCSSWLQDSGSFRFLFFERTSLISGFLVLSRVADFDLTARNFTKKKLFLRTFFLGIFRVAVFSSYC